MLAVKTSQNAFSENIHILIRSTGIFIVSTFLSLFCFQNKLPVDYSDEIKFVSTCARSYGVYTVDHFI